MGSSAAISIRDSSSNPPASAGVLSLFIAASSTVIQISYWMLATSFVLSIVRDAILSNARRA
jgi:hypothetical protein